MVSVCLSGALGLPSPSPPSAVTLWGELYWGNVSSTQVKGVRGRKGSSSATLQAETSLGQLLTPARSAQFEESVSNRKEVLSMKYKFVGPTKIMVLKISIS